MALPMWLLMFGSEDAAPPEVERLPPDPGGVHARPLSVSRPPKIKVRIFR